MTERSDEDVIANLIATAMPRTQTVQVCARGDLVDEHNALSVALAAALQVEDSQRSIAGGVSAEAEALHAQIEVVEAQMAESVTEFKLRSIGSLAWANLLRQHLPRPAIDSRLAFNLATFPPAAVAACSVSPKLSVEQATKLYGTDDVEGVIHSAEWEKLFSAAYVLNENATPSPKLPAAIGNLLRNGRSSTTAAPVESPEAGS